MSAEGGGLPGRYFPLAIPAVVMYLILAPVEARDPREEPSSQNESTRRGDAAFHAPPAIKQEACMRKLLLGIMTAIILSGAAPLQAQQPCPRLPVVINTPEDKLMLAVNGADTPQAQVDALNQYAADHADSKFIPCVNEYLTMTYVKLQDYDKAIEAGEKDLAANYLDVNLIVNLLKAYVGAGKASDNAFELINKSPQQIHDEIMTTSSGTAEEVAKARKAGEDQAKNIVAYMEYAFFQLLPRVTDAAKRVQDLDAFFKAYPNTPNMNQVNVQYFAAYQMAGNPDKMFEYGEKAVASDPNNVSTLNLVADAYATAKQPHLDQAGQYAQKAIELATNMQKTEGMTDEQFKSTHDTELGLAHSTLGYVEMQKGARTHRVATAIKELMEASDMLAANPALEARALYFLGYSYELEYPANHHLAEEALSKAASLDTPWKASAQDLLEKVKKAH
jgi:tetratricopeptide (TPR) repeat protein